MQKNFNCCCTECRLHFQCSFISSISEKNGILLYSFWMLKNLHWSRNHSLINIAVHSVMEVAHYFSYMKPVHCTIMYILYNHNRSFSWHCWMVFLRFNPKSNPIKLLGNTIIMQALQAFLIAQSMRKTNV